MRQKKPFFDRKAYFSYNSHIERVEELMGKFEKMTHLYHRKRDKARQQLKLLEEGKIKPAELGRLARKLLYKRFKAGHALRVRTASAGAGQSSPSVSEKQGS